MVFLKLFNHFRKERQLFLLLYLDDCFLHAGQIGDESGNRSSADNKAVAYRIFVFTLRNIQNKGYLAVLDMAEDVASLPALAGLEVSATR